MTRRIALTGASGFVGQALGRHLRDIEDTSVVGLARNPEGLDFPARAWAPDDSARTRQALAGADAVVHAAAVAHVTGIPADEHRRINRDLTLMVARQAANAGASRFVFLSSIGVNGSVTFGKPFDEHDEARPNGHYATAKLEAEHGLAQLAVETGLEVVVVRPPLVYGPAAPGNFGRLVQAVRGGVPLPFGRVTANRRSYIAIDNLTSFLSLVTVHPAAANELFVISDGEDVSTADLVRRIARACGRRARLVPVPLGMMRMLAIRAGKADEAERLLGDLRVDSVKARNMLHWRPVATMDQQLARLAS